MGEPALIGFHAAYRDDGSGPTEAGAANAILGAYLNSIGLPESAIVYITAAAPTSMTWLTLQEAAKYGIEVRPLPNAPSSPAPSSPAAFSRSPLPSGAAMCEPLHSRFTVLRWGKLCRPLG